MKMVKVWPKRRKIIYCINKVCEKSKKIVLSKRLFYILTFTIMLVYKRANKIGVFFSNFSTKTITKYVDLQKKLQTNSIRSYFKTEIKSKKLIL
jgi:hypothetical protein